VKSPSQHFSDQASEDWDKKPKEVRDVAVKMYKYIAEQEWEDSKLAAKAAEVLFDFHLWHWLTWQARQDLEEEHRSYKA
jgi:hypothetical protein